MQPKIRLLRVTVGIPWLDRPSAINVVGVIPSPCSLHLVEPALLQRTRCHSSVHGGLVYAPERLILRHPLRHIEAVQRDVTRVVVGKEARVDDLLRVVRADAQANLEALGLIAHGRLGVVRETSSVVGHYAPDGVHVRDTMDLVRDVQVGRVDDPAILHHVSRHRRKVHQCLRIHAPQAVDLLLDSRLIAPDSFEDRLSSPRVALVDSQILAIGSAIIPVQAQGLPSTEVAHDDRAAEQTAGRRRTEQRPDGSSARGLSVDDDLIVVAAERSDVGAHPLQSSDLVTDTVVALQVGAGDSQEAERGQAVVDGDDDDVLAGGELAAIGACVGTGAAREAAAVDPEVDRAEVGGGLAAGGGVGGAGDVRGLDVEEEAVFYAGGVVGLGALRAVGGCVVGLGGRG